MLNKANINWNTAQISKMAAKDLLTFDNIVQRSYVWEKERKSELIHSIIEGYPIPAFYAARRDKKVYDFLDGKQRVDAIRGFMNDEYHLVGIDLVTEDEFDEDSKMIDVSGMLYSELPENIRERIAKYSLTIYYFDDITPEQTRILFKKLNNGKPLSTKERNIANCIDIETVSEIGKHELFSKAVTEKALKARKQIPMIMKIWLMLNEKIDNVSFASADFNQVMEDTKISAEEKAQIESVLDKILEVADKMEEAKAKTARRKMLAETNLVSLVPFFAEAVEDGISSELIALFMNEIFTTKQTVSEKYMEASRAGSARNSSIMVRHEEINKAWKKFLTVEHELPEKEVEEVASDDAVEDVVAESVDEQESASTCEETEDKAEYRYGMRLRGFSPMCQPKEDLLRREDDESGKYHDIIVYDRELTDEEISNYELDKIA